MKKRLSLIGLFLALTAFSTHAQIFQMYSQDFESAANATYTLSAGATLQNSIVSGGTKSLKMAHSPQEVLITLDTIDFSSNATWNYFTLEFMHIGFIDPVQAVDRTDVCVVEAKLPGQTDWTRLNSSHYNMAEGGSSMFSSMGSFSKFCYSEWNTTPTVNNTLWKAERFDLDQLFQGVAVTDKKLIIRFRLGARANSTGNDGWYLDDIKVRASSQQIITPTISMRVFPDALNYPNSRGARLVLDATTAVVQGINSDSVYAIYKVGNSQTEQRAYLHRVGSTDRYVGYIPFYGYDTLMHYHLVVKDSTMNNNTVYFPKNSSQWYTYRCVRGVTNSRAPEGTQSNNNAFPFPNFADNRSEWIYDSVMMAEMGYGPGYITQFRFQLTASPQTVTRPRVQFRMANAPSSQLRTATMTTFTSSAMQIVYDSAFSIEQAAAGSYKMVNLQDTFYYAGGDLVVQVFYDGQNDPTAHSLKHIPTTNNKSSLWLAGHNGFLGFNAFTDENFLSGSTTNSRPWMQIYESKNLPLIHDAGVCAMSYPSYEVPCNMGADSVVVWLKNFGVHTINAVRLGYRIDNGAATYYNWTGSLAGGDSVRVHLNDNQTFAVGYHTINAWVEDSLTSDSVRYRDHEPRNNSFSTPFAVCDGPYSGVRTVGTGSSAHFATLEKCLYALSRCGVDGPLTIKLPSGTYDVTKFPYIPGTSATNVVTFEPAQSNGIVTFRRSRQSVTENVPALVDLSEARGIRFNNIRFANGRFTDNRCDVLVLLGEPSAHCCFENCQFIDSNSVTASAQALIRVEEADSVLIEHCTLYGGVIGVDLAGAAPEMLSLNNKVQFNDFTNQVNTAISVVNQSSVLVDSNFANDVLTNASYIILGQHVYDGSRIVRNRVFSSTGSCCIGVSDMHGTASNYCVVANNMLSSLDDGTSNMLTTPLNIIKGDYIKVVFNSVRMSAPTRVNVAAATLGGDEVSNIDFKNNVIATFDTSNYAFSFLPGSNESTLHVDYNCYYSTSGVLNKLTGVNYTNYNNWRNHVASDQHSVVGNPQYTNSSICRVDLRSFSAMLRNVGTPIPEVTIDLFGSPRNATAPSLGAYEVVPLSVDFAPVEFVTPLEDYCGAPASIPVEVAIKNTGSGTYTYTSTTPITVYYSIDNAAVQSFTITNRNCGPQDTIHFLSTRTMSLPSGANNSDRTYSIRWWAKCAADPDDLNDTSTWTVISRYAAPAPTVINQNVTYNTTATITPTAGINTWPISYYTSGNGRQQRSGISWYGSMDDTTCIHYGPSMTIGPLFADTTLYISQKRNLPLVKISEVMVHRTQAGATNPLPNWFNTGTNVAVELTNCGDYPANVEGDSVVILQTSASSTKTWVLPNVTIQPGASLVLQFKTSAVASDSSRTIYAPSTAALSSLSYTANFAVIYRDGGGVADAVPFNNIMTVSGSPWPAQGVPAAVWQGNAVDLTHGANPSSPTTNNPTAGASRIAWPTNAATASPTATATLWQVANESHPMHVGETEENLILYHDNGCEGARAAVNLHIIGLPTVDLAVEAPEVNEGCNLSTAEPVNVELHNYGSTAVSPVIVNYSLDGGATVACSDTLVDGLAAQSDYSHTFSTPLNMHAGQDTIYNIKVWVEGILTDISHANDTSAGSFISNYTPEVPLVASPQTVGYNGQLTLHATNIPNNVRTLWYDASHTFLGMTTDSIVTPHIYHPDTFYVKAMALTDVATQVGTQASTTNNNYPSPYNPKTRYVKEQYLYPAEQIQAAGHSAGTIKSISFFLSSLGNNVSNFTYSYYTIKMGHTPNLTFANTTYLTDLTEVYSDSNLTLNASNIGWVKHDLDTPFEWDGTSSIVVEVTRALNAVGPSAGANTSYTTQANTTLTKQNATTDMASQTAAGNKGNNRPDIRFGFVDNGCESAEATIYVEVVGVPPYDATLEWPASMDTMVIASCDTTNLDIVLRNRGMNDINNYTLRYKIDNGSWNQTLGNADSLRLGYTRTVPLLSTHLTPGRHTITAVVKVEGDTVESNDTISRFINVRFCTGVYTVGTGAGHDFTSLSTALDTLANAGVAGNVTFALSQQTFNGQYTIGHIEGASNINRVTFTTDSNATDRAKIMFSPTSANNYVMLVDGANFVTFDNIYFYANYTPGSSATNNNIFTNVVQIQNSENVTFQNCELRSRQCRSANGANVAATSTNSNIIILGDNNHFITVNNCLLDSGYYSVRTLNNTNSDNVTISDSKLLNFWYQGINIRDIDTLAITHDSLAAKSPMAGKAQTGIYIANCDHASVRRNFITLIDGQTGGKRGIQVSNCKGTNIDRVTIYNNMISLYGSGVNSLPSAGIWIDSTSKYVSVYFNSVKLYAGVKQETTKAFSCQLSSQVHVLNNIFLNESKGYAYYVAVDTCLASSNFNVYWSNSEPNENTGARKFAKWGGANNVDVPTLDSLRIINNKDPNSIEEFPYFVSDSVLKCALAQFAGQAQYNPDVTNDIYGDVRPQIPAPTIGAHEFNTERVSHDVLVATTIDPVMPAVTTGNNPDVYNIETDSILVRVRFYNNGTAPETGCTWYAYMKDQPNTESVVHTLPRLNVRSFYEDSVMIPSPLGVVDTQHTIVNIAIGPNITDGHPLNNYDTCAFFIYPAYDLRVVSVALDSTVEPNHCRMYAVPIKYTLKNDGKKDFPADFNFTLGYDYYCYQPATQSFPNFPGSNTNEIQNFGASGALPVGTTRDVFLSPANMPNLYPTNYIGDITAKFRGWVAYDNDVKPLNDTSSYINITSNHTPEMPVGHDTMVDYGSYGNLWATQAESRTIRWHRPYNDAADTVSGAFFYNGNNNYNRSTHWSSTPQYFHDSLYYLSCISSKNCTSYYSSITVGINPPLATDVSISEVLSPRGSGRVYLEVDTVKLRVVNYGSQPVSNIPIAFKFMNANGRTTYLEVHDTVRHTIGGRVGDNVQYYDYVFDTALLQINQPLSNTTFTLNAWVYHPDDMQRGNDTLRTVHTFRALAENIYDTINSMQPENVDGFDISYVSYNELDNIMPDLIGYDNLKLCSYNASNAEVPTLFIRHGTTDTLTIEVANNQKESDSSTAASLCVCIDYNRDGRFDFDGFENVTRGDFTKGVKVRSRQPYQQLLTIPDSAHYGYMRMLVWVDGDSTAYVGGIHNADAHTSGQMQQYLLYIQEPNHEDSVDAALTRVSYPRKDIVDENTHKVGIMLANKGYTTLTQASIGYSFADHHHIPQSGTINWTGSLEAGNSVLVELDSIDFYEGTTDLTCWVDVEGDTIHKANDTLHYRYHRWYVVELRFIDSFDQAIDKWYTPAGYNAYTRNYWERGIPSKSTISSAYSEPNAYVTSCTQNVVTGKRGNRSVLYTPIIDISQIRPDTINLLISENMAPGSYLYMEYKDYLGEWHLVDNPGAREDDPDNKSWYAQDNETGVKGEFAKGWTGTTTNGAYVAPFPFPTSIISGEFGQRLQFRFVYETEPTTSVSSAFGDGVAIDNFRMGRARRSVDVGVTEIVYPTDPQFGQTIYPRVRIHNYGYDSICNFQVAYRPYGTYLPLESICTIGIPVDGEIEYEFPDPFIITNEFPDTFSICAFTKVASDLYWDNDSTCKDFGLAPLANDLYMYQIVSPLNRAVAGDSISITVRLRNFGQNEIEECDVFYIYNGGEPVQEHVRFADYLGRNLGSTEFFNYTFQHHERATMGTMELTTWCEYDLDVYPYNDTLTRQIAGITALTDLEAEGVFVDTRPYNNYKVGLVINNVGARAANSFVAGYWYDKDTTTLKLDTVYFDGGIPSGGHRVFYFDSTLPRRSAPYDYVTAFVSALDDDNRDNDTTSVLEEMYVDLGLDKILVEENQEDSCRVRFVVTNHGNIPYYTTLEVQMVINGKSLKLNISPDVYVFDPGETRQIDMKDDRGRWKKIVKNAQRNYKGSGKFSIIMNDADVSNNETNVIQVVNYFESSPVVEETQFVLEQNYPNPFEGTTNIEFALPYGGEVHFFVNDVVGRPVLDKTSYYEGGRHTITLNKKQIPAGVYFYGIEFNGERRMHKMIVR